MVYLDYNATSPLSVAAQKGMAEAMEHWGNPSSVHGVGRISRELLEKYRSVVARALGASPKEVVFTSGGSESNASAFLGKALAGKGVRLLVSPVEHSSIRDLLPTLVGLGCETHLMKLLPSGELDEKNLAQTLESFRPNLVSLMVANNETGIVFPIVRVAELCRTVGAELHVDAVQALGKLPSSHWAAADYVSVSAHKVGGPKGVGALRVAAGRQLVPLFHGGNHELKRRGGTPNMVGIAGFAGALSDPISADERGRMEQLRDDLENRIRGVEGITIQGKEALRTPHTSNIRVEGVRAESLLTALDLDGICISTGAACSSGATKANPILMAMGMTEDEARECFRVSLGRQTTQQEIDRFVERTSFHIGRIRERRGRS
ncbi:MAG: cysteine desulfurase [Deltaproteobacteria bacterium]|nr:cysteine desulfurase [Deltaproteobacteria bacterium]MBI3293105.1 cysteine desulfurase [Deltaproteobacteria bacterium]